MPRPLSASLSGFTSALAVVAALAASTSSQAQNFFWDPTADGDLSLGGTGIWNTTSLFWDPTGLDPAAPLDNVAWPNSNTAIGIFQGTPGTVTINNAGAGVVANGLVFNVSGYTIGSQVAGDVLNLAGTTPTITTNPVGGFARINSIITGTAGLTTAGPGTLILGGANTYTGQTTIGAGSTVTLAAAAGLGANGLGNETIVASGGTLNIGGQAVHNNQNHGVATEEFRIAGAGVGGIGALINAGASQNNATGKVVLTADATISAGAGISTSYNAGGQIAASAGGRFDIRLGNAPDASPDLDLAGFTLTKKGSNLLALVNARVSDGNIIVDEGQLNLEANTIVAGTGTITVNPNGKLGFWSIANAANITRPIVVNGGTVGDPTSTGAAQTVNSPISFTGALNPNFSAISGNGTTLAGVISQSAFTGTELAKRGGGLLTFSNTGNTFSAPITVYAGTLRADYTTTLSGGVPPATPLVSTDTPLGTNANIKLAGGTLAIRANMDNNNTQQVLDLQKNITVDLAPGGMSFDRIGNTSQTDKHIRINSLTMAPASAANGWSIGQNQLTFSQGNTHRLEIPLMTMNSDSALSTGDFTMTGDVLSATKNSLLHVGGNTIQFIAPGDHQFNAFFNTAGTMRVGNGFGTPVTNNTVTVGTGTIYLSPGTTGNWRSATNIAAGQVIDATLSQRLAVPVLNFEQFSAIPSEVRAGGSGVYGIGSATYGDLDLSNLGDGTWRIGSNLGGSGNGTINGVIAAGAGNIVRMGGGGTATATATNAISGTASLEVGSPLLNNAQTTSGTGTAILGGANDYSGGTTVNRGSTLGFRNIDSLGSGSVEVFGAIRAEQAGGVFTADGVANAFTPILRGGSNLIFDNGGVSGTTDTNRWADAAPITLTSSSLTMNSRNNNASTTNEQVGAINVGGGSFVNVNRQNAVAGNVSQLSVASINRIANGTLEIVRSTGTGAGWGVGNFLQVTGTAPTVTNGIVAPWMVIQNANPAEFATYGASGFAPIAAYDNTIITGTYAAGALNYNGTTGGKLLVTTADLTLTDDPTLYAMRSERTINTSGANDTITLRTGGMILRNVSDNTTVNINPAIVANDGTQNVELLVNTNSGTGRNHQINGAITAAGLTKFGPGNLILTNANPGLTGPVTINQGTLEARAVGAAGPGMITLAGVGSQFNVRVNGANATYVNGLTIGQNIPVATLDVGNTLVNTGGATNASSITFQGAAAGTPGLIFAGSPTAQGQTLVLQTNGNGTGSSVSNVIFGTNMANSIAGNATFHVTGTRTLQLDNAATLTGTAPVITKSGDGTLIYARVGSFAGAPVGTKVVLNEGTLELRSVIGFGTGDTTTLELNRGTLNLRRDTAGKYGTAGSGVGYAVNVNGATAISVDRAGGSATNFQIGLGKMTIQTNGTLTVNNGNGIYLGVEGVAINGTAVIASNVGAGSQDSALRFLSGFDVSGGSIVKLGTGHLHLMNANNTYTGGTYVQQGTLRARATNALGIGTVYVNPGGTIDFDSNTNMAAGQKLIVASSGAHLPMISVNTNGLAHPTTDVDTTNAPVGIVGISVGPAGNYDNTVDLSALYGGGWSFGGVSAGAYDPTYTGPSIVAGSGNLYRLGGGGTSFAMGTDSARAARTNVLTGPNDVRLGFDSGNILVLNSTNFQYSIAGTNDYSGGETVIHRGMVARLFSPNDGVRSGLSNSAVDVFGVLSLSGTASLASGLGANVNNVTLHPGSALFLDNTNGAANSVGAFVSGNVLDRWNDTTPIALNGAMLNLIGLVEGSSSETVGNITYSGGARIRSARTNATTNPSLTATSILTINNLSRSGPGSTLMLQTAAAGSLDAASNYDRIIVTSAPAITNGMVTPSIVNGTDNTFVTYGANGFTNVAYDTTVGASPIPAGLAATAKVDVSAGAGVALSDNPVIYALRTTRDINFGGPFNTVTLRSGGLIAHGNNLTINPHLVFNDGTSNIEALIYNSVTATINGTITANGITKFGTGALVINVPQPDYASGWTVNSGSLQINDPQGLGQSVPGNGVTLNGSLTTGGQASQAFGQTQLNFNRDQGTSETVVFSGGPITVVNEATIRMGGGGDNKQYQIPNVTLDSTDTDSRVSLTVDVPNNRTRGTIPTLTLSDNAIVRVTDAGSTADTGRSVAAVVNSLVGANKELTKIGNRTLELPNDNSTTFTGGSITVSQGTVRVRHNGSLGSATTGVTIERNSTLEIDTPNFSPIANVTQNPGSIERWNREDARGTTYNLPAGVNLQLNTNLLGARTIGLNGGTIEGFLWTDHPATAVERTIGSAVTVNLLANSYVGQNIIQGVGYDAGRQPTTGQPFGDNNTGAFLRIEGNITGNFDLTKTGFDTVILAGTNNTYGNTIVDSGIIRVGVDDALPTNKVLTTRLNGILDLYGSNQTVSGIGTPTAGPNPGGVSVGSSGRITNSSPTAKILTVNNATNYTYNGAIDRNVALTKQGAGTLTLGGNNTYTGETVVEAGTLAVTGTLTGSTTLDVRGGATLDVSAVTNGPFVVGPAQTIEGSGTVVGPIVVQGNVSPGNSAGDLLVNGALTFSAGSTFTLEIAGPAAGVEYDQVTVASTGGPITLNGGTVTLSLSYVPVQGTTYTVIDNLSLAPITGTFANLPDGGVVTAMFNGSPWEFVADYQGGDGNDLVLTVPEPTSAAALLAGLGICAGLRRFRRRSAAV